MYKVGDIITHPIMGSHTQLVLRSGHRRETVDFGHHDFGTDEYDFVITIPYNIKTNMPIKGYRPNRYTYNAYNHRKDCQITGAKIIGKLEEIPVYLLNELR